MHITVSLNLHYTANTNIVLFNELMNKGHRPEARSINVTMISASSGKCPEREYMSMLQGPCSPPLLPAWTQAIGERQQQCFCCSLGLHLRRATEGKARALATQLQHLTTCRRCFVWIMVTLTTVKLWPRNSDCIQAIKAYAMELSSC